ncbi:hemicentin-1-like isoform X2 [Cololabis saira]|uniref:hemicentin-1-like isoform X2 n=1 Tax=Cololabis saira TaxID=129043 RepID=UPI002AD35111|nr:hemicentin-1-like isoform X2 [Cololabis saira]
MEAVVGLLIMLLGVSLGAETFCDGRRDGVQCFGALGGTVVLQLMDNASEIPRYDWRKNGTRILNGRKKYFLINTMETRSVFIPSNGTFLINNLIRTDGGQYTLRLQDSDGRQTGKQTLQLFIQAPVSSVLLVSECLSEGQMKVSCSSEGGDSPQYSWTLDGNTLTDSELLSGTTETNIIILKQNLSGRLVCSVRNHISRVSNETILTTCDGKTFCDGRRDGVQCFGALGGTVVLQLMDNTSEIHRYLWNKDGTIILYGRKNTIIINTMKTRSVFIPSNGTFLINNLIRTDGGQYTLKLQDSDGRQTAERTLQLFIQAPVSSVLLVSECLSEGQMCMCRSSEGGDSPQYSWTLDGNTLTDSELLSGTNETNIIILKQNLSGRLVCSVRNHISCVSNELMISVCRDVL